MDKIRWYSQTKYVDVDTGEIITKSEYQRRELRKLKTNKTTELKTIIKHNGTTEQYGIIQYTIECREHEQLKLF